MLRKLKGRFTGENLKCLFVIKSFLTIAQKLFPVICSMQHRLKRVKPFEVLGLHPDPPLSQMPQFPNSNKMVVIPIF